MATPTDQRVADLVREAADRLGYTHAALAALLGLGPVAFSDRMRGRTRWPVSEVATLARVLELDLHALLEEEAA